LCRWKGFSPEKSPLRVRCSGDLCEKFPFSPLSCMVGFHWQRFSRQQAISRHARNACEKQGHNRFWMLSKLIVLQGRHHWRPHGFPGKWLETGWLVA
jgi:hypothetical protein